MSVRAHAPVGNAGNVGSLLDHALSYHARGWTVFPVKGKKASVSWKTFQTTPPDEPTLRQLFTRSNVDGIAVVLGSASSGLSCRDYDDQASYDIWSKFHPELAAMLPTVVTHRGRHVYFRGPEGFTKFADGEYRGTPGQYTVLPPSRHPAGTTYRWLVSLPDGELPSIDPFETGLCNREDRENGANREDTRHLQTLLVSAAPTLLQGIEKAIVATLPATQGQRNRCVFRLARHLKAIPSLQDAAAGACRLIVQEWHRRALPIIGTKPFLDTWADFVQGWKRVRVPAGQDVLETAFRRAVLSAPLATVIKLYGEGPIVHLVALCRELQGIAGDSEFFIDCRNAGRLIEVHHTTAWRYLEVLCADGILAPGAKGSKATRKASRFRFIEQKP